MTAFFLEAGFLGVMLFGMQRVGKGLHFFATLMVAVGTLISAFWILSANSWMQTPAGYFVNAAGQFLPMSWWEIVFNPSFPYRLVHMVLAAYLTTALVVGAAGAFHLLRDNRNEGARVMFSMAMWMATLVAPIQIFAGDQHGLNTLEHQPVKVMAMEGHFRSHPHGAPLILFGLPDQAKGEMRYSIEIPKASSLILKHSLDAPLQGLDTVLREELAASQHRVLGVPDHGRAWAVDACCLGCSACCCAGAAPSIKSKLLHYFALAMGPSGFVAVLAGWTVTETGRQPFTVYGLLRTINSASPLAAPAVTLSLLAFVVVYFFVFAMGTYYILHLMAAAPHQGEEGLSEHTPTRAAGITPVPAWPQRAPKKGS